MKTIACAPEADLHKVAAGDTASLSTPILVAAADQAQLDAFVWAEGLVCTEVRRARGLVPDFYPENKILVLLPGWDLDTRTAEFVREWVEERDRYTVQLASPRPSIEQDMTATRRGLALMVVAAAVVVLWVIFVR